MTISKFILARNNWFCYAVTSSTDIYTSHIATHKSFNYIVMLHSTLIKAVIHTLYVANWYSEAIANYAHLF